MNIEKVQNSAKDEVYYHIRTASPYTFKVITISGQALTAIESDNILIEEYLERVIEKNCYNDNETIMIDY